jgi:hypothetical protein
MVTFDLARNLPHWVPPAFVVVTTESGLRCSLSVFAKTVSPCQIQKSSGRLYARRRCYSFYLLRLPNSKLTILYSLLSRPVIIFSLSTERPMKIEIVVDPSRPAPAASLAARVAPPPTAAAPAESAPRLVSWSRDPLGIARLNLPTLIRLLSCIEPVDDLVGDVVVEEGRTKGRPSLLLILMLRWRCVGAS